MASFGFRIPRLLLAVLAIAATMATAANDDGPSATPTPTTAPIFLPYYSEEAWSFVRGSIITSDVPASRTTYTIFCPTQTPRVCDLSLEFPFIIVEGPDIVEFHGTLTSTFIANVECDLAGTTAATCSGYSSYSSGYTNGHHTGPTEVSWTSTFTGTDLQWGTLTLTDQPMATGDDLDDTAGGVTPTYPSGLLYVPEPTSSSGVSNWRTEKRWAFTGIAASILGAIML